MAAQTDQCAPEFREVFTGGQQAPWAAHSGERRLDGRSEPGDNPAATAPCMCPLSSACRAEGAADCA